MEAKRVLPLKWMAQAEAVQLHHKTGVELARLVLREIGTLRKEPGRREAVLREVADAATRWGFRFMARVDDESGIEWESDLAAEVDREPPKPLPARTLTDVVKPASAMPERAGVLFQADDERVLNLLRQMDGFLNLYPETAFHDKSSASQALSQIRNGVRQILHQQEEIDVRRAKASKDVGANGNGTHHRNGG